MNNPFDAVRTAVQEAQMIDYAVKECAGAMAKLVVGRLRAVPIDTLKELKRELRDFNIHTGSWK